LTRRVARLIDECAGEALRLINADTQCRNTVVNPSSSGGEGTTVAGADPAARCRHVPRAFNGRRVPIYVIAIAAAGRVGAALQAIARNSGGGTTRSRRA